MSRGRIGGLSPDGGFGRGRRGGKGAAPVAACLLLCAACLWATAPISSAFARPPWRAPGSETCRQSADMPTVLIRRVAILPLPEPNDPVVRNQIAAARAAQQKPRRRSLFVLPGAAEKVGKPAASGARSVAPAHHVEAATTPEQLRQIAEALFADALGDRLHTHLKIALASSEEIQAALQALHLKAGEAAAPAGAQALRARLDCDAVLVPRLDQVRLHEGATRDVTLWATVQVASLRAPTSVPKNPYTGTTGSPSVPIAPRTGISVAGAASASHVLFRSAYAQTPVQLAQEAGRHAAAQAVHALWTGESAPLTRRDERIALVPTPTPTQADALLFTSQGRRIAPAAVRNLPAEVPAPFLTGLLSQFPDLLHSEAAVNSMLRQQALSPAMLWEQDGRPHLARVQALGQRLGVQYLLMACVTDLEVDEGPPSPLENRPPAGTAARATGPANAPAALAYGAAQEPPSGRKLQNQNRTDTVPSNKRGWEREARAEAVGALVRVSDGALLWQDRATASMIVRLPSPADTTAATTDRQVVEDAVHFALIQLQRQFRGYREGFER